MTPCDHWREELADHVLGAPAGSALTAHLEKCAACSAARAEWQGRMTQIDAGIGQLATSEPSAGAASRVLGAVRSRRHRLFWVLEWKTAVALATFVMLATGVAYSWRTRGQRKEAERVISAATMIANWRSPTEGLLRSSSAPLLESVPRLGEYFYELKIQAPEKEKDNP